LFRFFNDALTSINPAVFDQLVEEVINEYKDQVYTYTRDLVRRLKKEGYALLAISGSHHELVEQIAKAYEFDDWVGSQYERDGNTFTGKSFIASLQKDTVLKDLIQKHNLSLSESYAIGDSKSDAPMLTLVEHPIAFNPDQHLFKIAQEHGWDIVIERKNMIYQLEHKSGKYLLAKTN
jgi:HAD superfamily phosphoserine phosphatase-like hydrolase